MSPEVIPTVEVGATSLQFAQPACDWSVSPSRPRVSVPAVILSGWPAHILCSRW